MPLAIDFDKLLDNLFQAKTNTPVKEKVQEAPKPKRDNADIHKALEELFSKRDTPVEENVRNTLRDKKIEADPSVKLSKGLHELFRKDGENEAVKSPTSTEAEPSSLQACNLYVFMKKIVIGHFGMGYDDVIEIDGHLVKSWFTIPEAIETAEKIGYRLTVAEARAFLDTLINKRYIETDNYKYRRCEWWDGKGEMERYLQRYGR